PRTHPHHHPLLLLRRRRFLYLNLLRRTSHHRHRQGRVLVEQPLQFFISHTLRHLPPGARQSHRRVPPPVPHPAHDENAVHRQRQAQCHEPSMVPPSHTAHIPRGPGN